MDGSINSPQDKIEELLTRGVDTVYPTKEDLEKVLRSGKKLKIFQGFDPTGTQLHIGHMVGLRKLRQWQDLGHKVIFLIGDFTAMVGDPTGKLSTRKVLTHEQVMENAKSYKEQARRILRFSGENPVEIVFNGEWLGKLSAMEFLGIARLLSVQQVVERDMFQERQKKGDDVYMNEFLYPVMQAYDSVAMNVDIELGGTDQMFNMLMGRKLMRHMLKKDKFVITTPILADSSGTKIGKTEGNVIGLTDEPIDLFRKIMSLPDDIIAKGMEYLTDIPIEEVRDIENDLKKGTHPVQLKKRLAFEIVKQLNDEKAAEEAQKEFERVVQRQEMPEEIPSISLKQDLFILTDLLVETGLASSKSEAKRLVEQGGVEIDNERQDNPSKEIAIEDTIVIKVGKRKFVQVNKK